MILNDILFLYFLWQRGQIRFQLKLLGPLLSLPKMVSTFKVGFEGTKGSYSEDALLKLFETQPSFKNKLECMVGVESFESVCQKVQTNELDLGIIPVESSISGTFYGVVDLIKV